MGKGGQIGRRKGSEGETGNLNVETNIPHTMLNATCPCYKAF